VEEVDALTGTAIGWPRTGTFRLADMVGIDILAHVAANFNEDSADGGALELIRGMVERGWLGDKAGQGFYKKSRDANGEEQRLALDWSTFEYRPLAKAKIPSLEMAKNAASRGSGCACCWPMTSGKTKPRRFCGLCWRICGTTRLTALGKWRMMRFRSTARFKPGSTGSWGRLRCGMRLGCLVCQAVWGAGFAG
jgi:hypothetical protein